MRWREEKLKLTKQSNIDIPHEIVDACLKWAAGNSYGGEFDRKAVERMICGSWQLKRFLKLGKEKKILEVGPFFNPQVNPKSNPGNAIVY
jgi:hypothetical protein